MSRVDARRQIVFREYFADDKFRVCIYVGRASNENYEWIFA